MSGNEEILKLYECQEGCSKCGPKTTTALTDTRLITRRQECSCCGTGAHMDTTIYLADIELMRESRGESCGSILRLVFALVTCTWPCLLCTHCCNQPKMLEVKGSFGSEMLAFDKKEANVAAIQLSSSIREAKTKVAMLP